MHIYYKYDCDDSKMKKYVRNLRSETHPDKINCNKNDGRKDDTMFIALTDKYLNARNKCEAKSNVRHIPKTLQSSVKLLLDSSKYLSIDFVDTIIKINDNISVNFVNITYHDLIKAVYTISEKYEDYLFSGTVQTDTYDVHDYDNMYKKAIRRSKSNKTFNRSKKEYKINKQNYDILKQWRR
jgi:hypothetical protein